MEEQVDNLTPERFASFSSKMFFSWFDGLAWKGWRRTLTKEDLWNLTPSNRSSNIIPVWDKNWEKETKKAKKEFSILTTLILCFGGEFFWSSVLNFIYTLLQYVSPQIVNLLIG